MALFRPLFQVTGTRGQGREWRALKVNGRRARPSSDIRPGDVIEIIRDQLPWRLEAGPLPLRRGPAREARQSYTEDQDVSQRREELVAARKMDRLQMPQTDGRPDKHTRRKLRQRRRT